MNEKRKTAILLLSCKDRIGLVSRISHFIFERGGNILDLNEHVDTIDNIFSLRVSWDLQNFSIPMNRIEEAFRPLAEEFGATWRIKFTGTNKKVAIFVSKYDHCLQEILWRQNMGEFLFDIPLIISNHPDLEPLANHYNIPYYVFPITKKNKLEQEKKELELLKKFDIDTIVLARYMQIVTPQFIENYANNIINIHHSFLPAFIGGNPYRRAYERGVKIIGATSHFVTADIDEGPIIEQDIIRISHKDSVNDLIRKGRDLERLVLARALHFHSQHRILVNGNKTIIFE